jgi:hypothetical protein
VEGIVGPIEDWKSVNRGLYEERDVCCFEQGAIVVGIADTDADHLTP